jgi:hypothetical protein
MAMTPALQESVAVLDTKARKAASHPRLRAFGTVRLRSP